METITQKPPQTEVSLRTLASDLKAIARGVTAPAPEILAVVSNPVTETPAISAKPKNIGRTIMLTLALLAILAVGYFYLYPKVKMALTGSIVE